ncbi:toxin glutamine deamidase domain-containing protein [Streptacidiphilus jiangxiensis]|uniref:Immunity protein 35 n=1 Tax=Streptacidiphilus jiangxiensis TaxID=235985 RepID=A0A1H7U983_STRJI|nr:toxin glutamine deamidase domain-containing protein [Streptacidiphilus jiangxiensis]SEL93248.1 Immunity protein 35 [Streptacidiphilus jiangxiensis]
MTRQQAVAAVRAFLGTRYPVAPPTVVVREEWAEEFGWAWRVTMDVQEFLDTGDARHRPFSRALYVRKETGEVAWVPTALSTEQSARFLETGEWPFRPATAPAAPAPAPAAPAAAGPPDERARAWLREVHGSAVELASPRPVAEGGEAWWFALRPLPQPGHPTTPMLNASLVVPRDGSTPFHPGNGDPWGDVAALTADPRPRLRADWERRVNARGCVVAVDAGTDGVAATALPWQPVHEAPGWWERLLYRHFPGAQVAGCADWNQVLAAVGAGGPGTRGVVRVHRELGGLPATGHLLYALNDGHRVVILDGQTGGLARLDTLAVRGLTLARFHRPLAHTPSAPPGPPSAWPGVR